MPSTHGFPALIIIASLTTAKGGGDFLVLTKKFVTGVQQYQQYWPGTVKVLIEMSRFPTNNLDNAEYLPDQLPFIIEVLDFKDIDTVLRREPNSVVLAVATYRQNHVSEVCEKLGLPVVYTTETTLTTRLQMIKATEKNIFRKIRRYAWEWSQYRREIRAVSRAQGVQCNGYPTFEIYRKINPCALLYFDTRIFDRMIESEAELEQRIDRMMKCRQLKLFFSGRLTGIKGVDHLPEVARELDREGVDFDFAIAGAGELEEFLRRRIKQYGLQDKMRLIGNLDFESELIPYVKREVDIFVCCHPQGDPSCTYLETMNCGVPIVGYDNEAFTGLVGLAGSGWLVKMDRPDLLVERIRDLSNNRQEIATSSRQALFFARQHSFESTFRNRIAHLEQVYSSFVKK